MNRGLFQVLLCALLLVVTSTPAWAHCRPENRVGGSPGFSSNFTTADAAKPVAASGENPACGYDFASGLHKYLYCQADPVDGIDPSGNDFELGGLSFAMGALGSLGSLSSAVSSPIVPDLPLVLKTIFPASMGSLSPQGLRFIEDNEGGFKPRIYNDAAGFPTIGYGHKVKPSEQAQFANGITEQKGSDLLRADSGNAQRAIKSAVISPVNQYQFDALVDFTFNEGSANFKSSTLLTKLNQWDYEGAANEFPKWVYARVNGAERVLPGLVTRRNKERVLFKGEVWRFKSVLGIDPY